ncbi:hypothetical protein D3C80_1724300 [compost metagenome]
MIQPMRKALITYPPAMLRLLTGEELKSLIIFFSRSLTSVPKAPMVVVTDVTANSPAIIQLSIRKRIFAMSLYSLVHTSPKNKAYRPIIINTASNEKNTVLLSLKKRRRFRLANPIIV